MKTIIHDLKEKELKKLKFNPEDKVINALECQNHCIGCFSCWIKHPKKCIYQDNYSDIAEYMKDSDELVLISQNKYGVYSSSVKKVLERCIGYVLPYFTIREGAIHHKSRFKNQLKLTVYMYGNITENDKLCLSNLVKANSINLNTKDFKIYYVDNIKELKNVYVN